MVAQKSVLVADDEPGFADMTSLILRDAGYRVVTAMNGAGVLQAVAAEPFAVALLNMMMPGPVGQELYGAVRALPYGNLPVVFMTSLSEETVRRRVQGDYGYLGKPFTARDLMRTVRHATSAPDDAIG